MTDTLAEIATKVAVLEVKINAMEDFSDDLRGLRDDIHEIKETIAAGKGAWWALAALLGLLTAVAGGAGALIHKLLP